MTTTLEELTADPLSREHVEGRVKDWKRRIESLYAEITGWLSPEWSVASQTRHVRMLEEPMRSLGLEAVILPSLDLMRNGQWSVAFVPGGLWIIGANGRVDVLRPDQMTTTHFIVDAAEHFEAPEWWLVALDDRSVRRRLDQTSLQAIL